MATDITRDVVLSVAAGLRVSEPSTGSETATDNAVRSILRTLVTVDADDLLDYTAYPTVEGDVEGVLIDATVYRYSTGTSRSSTVVAVAATDESSHLTGSVTITSGNSTVLRSALSGSVAVTEPVDTARVGVLEVIAAGTLLGPGEEAPVPSPGTPSPEPTPAPGSTPIPRTQAEKAAARAAYDRELQDARKKYAKAKKKAGKNKRKKAAAKKKYARRKDVAKARYRAAIADVVVGSTVGAASTATSTTVQAQARAFRVTISTDAGWAEAG